MIVCLSSEHSVYALRKMIWMNNESIWAKRKQIQQPVKLNVVFRLNLQNSSTRNIEITRHNIEAIENRCWLWYAILSRTDEHENVLSVTGSLTLVIYFVFIWSITIRNSLIHGSLCQPYRISRCWILWQWLFGKKWWELLNNVFRSF